MALLNKDLNVERIGTPTSSQYIEATHRSDLGGRKYMQTTARLTRDGRLSGTTRTYTGKHLEGFTGGVKVAIVDHDGGLAAATSWRRYGVDGKKMPGQSDRTETWFDNINPTISKTAGGIIIMHAHKPNVQKRIDDFYDNAKKAADLIQEGSAAGASISGLLK